MQQELNAIKLIEDLTAHVDMGPNSKVSNRDFHLNIARATASLRQYFQQAAMKAQAEAAEKTKKAGLLGNKNALKKPQPDLKQVIKTPTKTEEKTQANAN